MHPVTKYARSGDVQIAYQVSGDGPFDLILAPGTMSHLDLDWERPRRVDFINRMSSVCRFIRFDKRGTGLSDRPTRMATLEERADDIRAVMDAIGIERANILGASEGGSMACMFAATYPKRTQTLLTWGAQAKWVWAPDHPWGFKQEEYEKFLAEIEDGWPSEYYVRGPGAGLGPDAPADIVETMQRYMRAAASPSAVLAYERMNGEIDTRPILPLIQVPTLVMNRTGDPVAHVEAARDMSRRIPGAKFKEYPGESHAIMLDDMDTIIGDIAEFITGERPVEASDRVLATVMFLDVVGSTEKAAELGDARWKHVLESYYALVRKELTRHRGVEVSTSGDGFFATFDGPARAVRCALAIADGVRQLGVEVRAGVHTGECEVMGDNVGGIAVHIGARVMSQAAASQVLVSSTVKDLAAGSGIALEPVGARELKGVPGEWSLFAAAQPV